MNNEIKFTHLHVHSHYSLLDGLPKIGELVDYVKELGMDSVAVTDHGVLYGAVEFYKKAKAAGIKPIIGAEVYTAFEGMDQKRPGIDDKRYHLVLLVKNEAGYKNLVKLLTKAHLEGFYYKPRVDEKLLEKHSEGLIALTACIQGKIPRLILANKIEEAEKTALKYQKIFGKGNFYLEVQDHPNIPAQGKVNKALIAISKKLDIPLVATQDSHYLRPEDARAQDILMLINTGADINDPERLSMLDEDFSIKPTEQMAEAFKDVPEAITNTQKIVEACNFEMKLGQTQVPQFPIPEGKTPDQYLKELCLKGIAERYPNDSNKKEVDERLDYELDTIAKIKLAPYFLIVQDFVNWAKEQSIVVGPGRGSAAGSLVSYLVGITDVDPLEYGLLFERFLNLERISFPDIDLDFTDTRRDEVINYVSDKYGRDRVAQIITFGTMAARAALRDVGRALGYSYSYCDKIAKMIPMFTTLGEALKKVDEFKNIYEAEEQARTLIDLAQKLEGVARHASTHACGVVIGDRPLTEITPLQRGSHGEETVVTQYEMHAVEDIGLLKMDFLGLKNLTIIEKTIKLIKAIHKKEINISKIPKDDEKTFELFREGNTTSVFQLESDGMKRYLKQLKPTQFEDIIAMVALYRPGPIQYIPDYIKRKHKEQEVHYLHPKLESILGSTYGIGIYQEQMMRIARDLAGFSLGEADVLRKAIGKKIKSLLNEQKEKLIVGMQKNGINEKTAKAIWELFPPFARYGFPRAHATSYAVIAYRTAYLKANWPVEFMAAVLSSEKQDVERIAFLIDECKKMNLEVLAPDINESFKKFTVTKEGKIRFGLLAIKNVGQNVVETIVEERQQNGIFQSIDDFITRIHSRDLNKKSLESLIKAGAFDKLGERNQLLHNLENLLECSREMQKSKANGQKGLFDNGDTTFKNTICLAACDPAKEKEKLVWEKELLGLYVTSHPLEAFSKVLKKRVLSISFLQEAFARGENVTPVSGNSRNNRIKIGCVISSIKKIITKVGKPMLFMRVEDLTSNIEVVIFPGLVEQKPALFQENKIVLIKGRMDQRDGVPKIVCEEIEEIIEQTEG